MPHARGAPLAAVPTAIATENTNYAQQRRQPKLKIAEGELRKLRQTQADKWPEHLKFMDRGVFVEHYWELYCFDTLEYVFPPRVGQFGGLHSYIVAVGKLLLYRQLLHEHLEPDKVLDEWMLASDIDVAMQSLDTHNGGAAKRGWVSRG